MTSSTICVDANLVIRFVVDPADRPVQQRWRRWLAPPFHLVAPTLLHDEVTNGLYQYQKLGMLDADTVRAAQETALMLPIELHGDVSLQRAALALASRFRLKATYDAQYLALAERLGIHLYTRDERLWKAVRNRLKWVHYVPKARDDGTSR